MALRSVTTNEAKRPKLHAEAPPFEEDAFASTIRRCYEQSERLGRVAEVYLRTCTGGRLLRQPTEKTAIVGRRDVVRREVGKVLDILRAVLSEEFGVNGTEIQSAVV